MLARQRHERILEALRASGGVRVSDLTEQLHVSYMTIRRDLDALAERGLVEKVHGGATVATQRTAESATGPTSASDGVRRPPVSTIERSVRPLRRMTSATGTEFVTTVRFGMSRR